MHKRLSTLMKSSGSRAETVSLESSSDAESKVSEMATIRASDSPPAPPSLKVKRVDYYYSWWTRSWKYRNSSAKITVEEVPIGASSNANDPWKDFLFVVVRNIPRQETAAVTVKIVIKSPYILKACKEVIQSWPGVSWNADPLEMDPEILLIFYDQFIAYRDSLQSGKKPTQEDIYTAQAVDVLINTLANDFKTTLSTLRRLTSHGEIQWDLLPYILVPRTLFVARCVVTGQPRLFKLRQWVRATIDGRKVMQLTLESVDMVDQSVTQSVGIGRVMTTVSIRMIRGVVRIQTLDAYPIKFFSGENGMREQELKEMAIERGKKWFGLFGIHHVQYDGVAALKVCDSAVRHHVKSRIMVDRATFRRLNANYNFPTPVPRVVEVEVDEDGSVNNNKWIPNQVIQRFDPYGVPIPPATTPNTDGVIMESHKAPYEEIVMEDYKDEDYLLASTVVYGFSLADKIWLEFSVDNINPVSWNTSAFTNLVLPPGRKDLLKSLVESHHKELNFDDFIKGKGHGLVINLFGPPGVGKTFSAEATSEHVQRPLYVVGAGDLGTNAAALDAALDKVFDLATVWKAIVLIDEADVFLEQRSLHDLERNAMVAVFLRHVEYYRGILFLTTNRVKAFDEAFLSRIHVALHFSELSVESKIQVWKAFLKKVDALSEDAEGHTLSDNGTTSTTSTTAAGKITEDQVGNLAKREINGRQIKNAVRTAQSLAAAKKQKMTYGHLMQTLDAMEEFTREFEKANA